VAIIETIVEGYDVGQVNLWPGPTDSSRPVGRCYRGERVQVLGRSGEYVQVQTSSGARGWCADALSGRVDPGTLQVNRLPRRVGGRPGSARSNGPLSNPEAR
jgi:hypothetical protein